MTLDEAIKHCEEVAISKTKQVENGDWEKGSSTERDCIACADEHRQLAEWLKELKEYREQRGERMNEAEKERLIKKDIASIENRVRHAFNQGYEMGLKESRSEIPNKWIPVSSKRLPDNTDPVSITWVNHDPESYYADIKDKSFTSTGHYCNGRWWWYSVTCQDYLDEYGRCDVDSMDDAIEVIAWMPLPKPYKAESEEQE